MQAACPVLPSRQQSWCGPSRLHTRAVHHSHCSLHHVPFGECTPCGVQVHSELDPQKALQWVAASPFLPDIVLVDCMMPGRHPRPHQQNMLPKTASRACCPSLSACW